MSSFITWLWNKASYVYAWFSSDFPNYLNAARNTWNWIISKALETYNNAINWAYTQINIAKANILGWIDWLDNKIDNLRNEIPILVNNFLAGFIDDAKSMLDWLEYKVNNFISDINYLRNNVTDAIKVYIQNKLDEFTQLFFGGFGWLLAVKDFLIDIASVLNIDDIIRLQELARIHFVSLKNFLDNPIKFITDIITDRLLYMLEWAIGKALGSVKYELPDREG